MYSGKFLSFIAALREQKSIIIGLSIIVLPHYYYYYYYYCMQIDLYY